MQQIYVNDYWCQGQEVYLYNTSNTFSMIEELTLKNSNHDNKLFVKRVRKSFERISFIKQSPSNRHSPFLPHQRDFSQSEFNCKWEIFF